MTFYTRINFITREKIVEDYKAGATALSLSEKYGCNHKSVYRILNDANVETRGHKFDSNLADALRKEYEAGATSNALAEKYNTTRNRVCRYIRQAGGQLRPRGPRPT